MKGISLALVSIAFGAVGQVTLKIGADKLGGLSLAAGTITSDIIRVIKTTEIIIGLVLFGISSFLWIKVLTRADLSQVYPLVSISYIIVAVLSYLLLREQFTIQKVLGIAVIISGVIVLNT